MPLASDLNIWRSLGNNKVVNKLAVNMKAELQEVMNMLRKLQGAIDFGNAPVAEREELAGDVTDIMDALFEVMKRLPDD